LPPLKEEVKVEEKGDPMHDKPFKPSNPAKRGIVKGTICNFPNWEKDPTFL
jgi:hypothetical protein